MGLSRKGSPYKGGPFCLLRGVGEWIHRLSDINEEERTGVCSHCGPVKVRVRRRTPDGINWRCSNTKSKRTPEQNRARKLRELYGISVEQYDRMLESQGGVCAVCKQEDPVEGRRLAVDHDHETGRVRGLLCTACNRGIGCLQDSPTVIAAALAYLTG